MSKLSVLNCADDDQAVEMITPLIERASDIALKVARRRPFNSAEDLSEMIRTELLALSEPKRIELFNAHPELAPENPVLMTKESQSEQGRLNLTSQDVECRERLSELNALYREKNGFPFITALVRHSDINSVLTEFETRMERDRNAEIQQAVDEIVLVSTARVYASFGPGDNPVPKVDTSST